MKKIDLEPHDWRSDKNKPREPFFGPGLKEWGPYLLGLTIFMTAMYYARHY